MAPFLNEMKASTALIKHHADQIYRSEYFSASTKPVNVAKLNRIRSAMLVPFELFFLDMSIPRTQSHTVQHSEPHRPALRATRSIM